jgi:hypothetical protein
MKEFVFFLLLSQTQSELGLVTSLHQFGKPAFCIVPLTNDLNITDVDGKLQSLQKNYLHSLYASVCWKTEYRAIKLLLC